MITQMNIFWECESPITYRRIYRAKSFSVFMILIATGHLNLFILFHKKIGYLYKRERDTEGDLNE